DGIRDFHVTGVQTCALPIYMDTTDEWIVERTGIRERRFFKEGYDTVSKMGARASMQALEKARLKPTDIDMVVFATLSPDYNFPRSEESRVGKDCRSRCASVL